MGKEEFELRQGDRNTLPQLDRHPKSKRLQLSPSAFNGGLLTGFSPIFSKDLFSFKEKRVKSFHGRGRFAFVFPVKGNGFART